MTTRNIPAPPPTWYDHEAVDRAVHGTVPVGRPLSTAELREAALQLQRRGCSIHEIATRLHARWGRVLAAIEGAS